MIPKNINPFAPYCNYFLGQESKQSSPKTTGVRISSSIGNTDNCK